MAKEYSIELTLTLPFTARNMEQAEERAATLDNDIGEALGKLKLRWLGDLDYAWGDIEEEE